MSEQPRRRALICVTPELIAHLWRGKFEVVGNPLPKDAKVVGAGYDLKTDRFYCVVESEEFRPQEVGNILPELPAAEIHKID